MTGRRGVTCFRALVAAASLAACSTSSGGEETSEVVERIVVTVPPVTVLSPGGADQRGVNEWFPNDFAAAIGVDVYDDLVQRLNAGAVHHSDLRHMLIPDNALERGFAATPMELTSNGVVAVGDDPLVTTSALGGWRRVTEHLDGGVAVVQTAALFPDPAAAQVALDGVKAGFGGGGLLLNADGSNVPDAVGVADPRGLPCSFWAGMTTGQVAVGVEIRGPVDNCFTGVDDPFVVLASMMGEMRSMVAFVVAGGGVRQVPEPGTHDRVRGGEITADDLRLTLAVPQRVASLFGTGALTVVEDLAVEAGGRLEVPPQAAAAWLRSVSDDVSVFTQVAVLHNDAAAAERYAGDWQGWGESVGGVNEAGELVEGVAGAQRVRSDGRCDTRVLGRYQLFTIEFSMVTPTCSPDVLVKGVTAVEPVLDVVISTSTGR